SAVAARAKQANDLAHEVPLATPGATRAPATTSEPATAAAPATTTAPAEAATVDTNAPVGHVVTDVLDLDISTRGGTIQRVDLPKYEKVKGEPTPVRLENVDDPTSRYLLESGLTGTAAGQNAPNQEAMFSASQSSYQLDSRGELRVPLTWTSDGI